MKKCFFVIVLLICVSVICTPTTYGAYADGKFLRVITADTPFFADANSTAPLFYLPYTYYVKVIDNGNTLTKVEYGGINGDTFTIDGYVPTDLLYDDALPVVAPSPEVKITTAKDTLFYKDLSLSTYHQYVFSGRELNFYGIASANGYNLYYVSYNGKLGYVKESDLIPFTVKNHSNELTFIETSGKIQNTESKTETKSGGIPETLRFLILLCLALAGITALFFVIKFRPKPSQSNDNIYDNDYE